VGDGVSGGAAPVPAKPADGETPVILYDGWCNLCDSTVGFLIRRDRRALLRFAALQSPAGAAWLGRCPPDERADETFVLVYRGRCQTRSEAVLTIFSLLPWPWPLLSRFRVLPRKLRDRMYQAISRRRTAWFGRAGRCMTELDGYQDRFVGSARL
jgi:predicted DCC family thiol-disulfide oxidoreductase YuxK